MYASLLVSLVFASPALAPSREASAKAAASTPGPARIQAHQPISETIYAPLERGILPRKLASVSQQILGDQNAPPLLIPQEALDAADVLLVKGAHWYSLSYSTGGVTVTLLVRQAAVSASWLASKRVLGPVISRSHGVVTLDLNAGGAAVTLDIECLGGSQHPRCGQDDEVWKLANSLRWIRKP